MPVRERSRLRGALPLVVASAVVASLLGAIAAGLCGSLRQLAAIVPTADSANVALPQVVPPVAPAPPRSSPAVVARTAPADTERAAASEPAVASSLEAAVGPGQGVAALLSEADPELRDAIVAFIDGLDAP